MGKDYIDIFGNGFDRSKNNLRSQLRYCQQGWMQEAATAVNAAPQNGSH